MKAFSRGFTLIELLIVVLIIAILAAIAVPNFLEFQTRAKVSRMMADMRSLTTALEAYYVDHNEYPWVDNGSGAQNNRGPAGNAYMLSTPVAYISNARLVDVFYVKQPGEQDFDADIRYMNIELFRRQSNWPLLDTKWVLLSRGPDREFSGGTAAAASLQQAYAGTANQDPRQIGGGFFATSSYDPTNGTVSAGDILRFAGQ